MGNDGMCYCQPGFAGASCQLSPCPKNCNNNGKCVSGKCQCNNGWQGDACTTYKFCLEVSQTHKCSGHGECDEASKTCKCASGFSGKTCSDTECPRMCSGHGECIKGSGCKCADTHMGNDC